MTDAPLDNSPGSPPRMPPPELVIAAFQKARRAWAGQGARPESSAESSRGTEEDGLPSGSGEETDTGLLQNSDADTAGSWAEETLAAFRAADGVAWNGPAGDHTTGDHTKGPGSADTDSEESEEGPAETAETPSASSESESGPEATPVSAEEMEEETDRPDELNEASDDCALAFRRAFYKRRVRHETDNPAGSSPTRTVAFPSRPASSFLWVTGRSEGGTTSVGIQNLSGLRARRAGAFLLRGEGKAPYRRLRRIRHHPEPRIFLKPVFWRAGADQESPVVDHVDGTWTPQTPPEALQALRECAATINRRIRDVVEDDEAAVGTDAEQRLLCFIATRTDEFSRRRVGEGVVYPRLTPLLGGSGRAEN